MKQEGLSDNVKVIERCSQLNRGGVSNSPLQYTWPEDDRRQLAFNEFKTLGKWSASSATQKARLGCWRFWWLKQRGNISFGKQEKNATGILLAQTRQGPVWSSLVQSGLARP
jgi:hypothetical protein